MPQHRFFGFIILLVVSTAFTQSFSQAVSASAIATFSDRSVQLKGDLSDPAWVVAPAVELTYEVRPGDNFHAKVRTFVSILYNKESVYFGFRCIDPNPDQIRANLTVRDNIFNDDNVFVVLDFYNDKQKGVQFGVNPFGVQADVMWTRDTEDPSYDLVWFSAAAKNDSGWTAEIMLPYSNLSFPAGDLQEWGLHLFRNYPRESRFLYSWMPLNRAIPSALTQMGVLKGINVENLSGTIELLPYVLTQKSIRLNSFNNPDLGFAHPPAEGRTGVGIKYSPSSSLSLNAVINPDFSQIESDAAQIEVNSAFALNYPEKRPFFLQGAELFSSDVYHSRSINDPYGAATIIGKAGSLSYFTLAAYDRSTVITVPNEDRSHTVLSGKRSFASVTRLRYDFGEESFIGTHFYSRNLDDGENYLFGADFNYRINSSFQLFGEYFASVTREMVDTVLFNNPVRLGTTDHSVAFDGERYSGFGQATQLSFNSRHYNARAVYRFVAPTFQTYNGLVPQVNYHELFSGHSVKLFPEDSFIDEIALEVSAALKYTFNGNKKEQFLYPELSVAFKGQTSVGVAYMPLNDEVFYGSWFKNMTRLFLNFNSRPLKELSFYGRGSIGKYLYRTSSPQLGEGHTFSMTLELKPDSKLNVGLSYARARLSSEKTGELFYDGNIYRGNASYQFSPELLLRVIVEFNTFEKAYIVYPLLSYRLNAFTTFFLGANSEYLDFGEPFGTRNAGQQYFLKLQYLLGFGT